MRIANINGRYIPKADSKHCYVCATWGCWRETLFLAIKYSIVPIAIIASVEKPAVAGTCNDIQTTIAVATEKTTSHRGPVESLNPLKLFFHKSPKESRTNVKMTCSTATSNVASVANEPDTAIIVTKRPNDRMA